MSCGSARAARLPSARSGSASSTSTTRAHSRPALSCADNVALPLALGGVSPHERRQRALALLDAVGLAERAGDPPAELSGGEQQRVAACAALVHQPALLLADEPAGELDAGTARTVYRLLAELVAQVGTTLVIVSHDEAATELADRVVHVRDGRISGEVLRGGPPRLVVGRGGWVRLPESARDEAGIGGRASWRYDEGEVALWPATAPPPATGFDARGRRLPPAARSSASSAASTRATAAEPARIGAVGLRGRRSHAAGWSLSRDAPAPARRRCSISSPASSAPTPAR